MTDPLEKRLSEYTAGWPTERKADLLAYLKAQHARESARQRYTHPAQLADALDPAYVVTPAIDLISRSVERVIREPRRNLLVTVPPQEGKLLPSWGSVLGMSLDRSTGVLSDSRFLLMEDIKPGDHVYHPDGHPVKVIAKTERQHDRPLYRVSTSDGRSVVVDAEHVWTVRDLRRSRTVNGKRRRGGPWETRTTRELLDGGLYREPPRVRPSGTTAYAYRYVLPRQHAVQTPDVDTLPIPPYALGLWLADGHHGAATITEGVDDTPELVRHLEASGVSIAHQTPVRRPTGNGERLTLNIGQRGNFVRALRTLDVFQNKHIPDRYLTAGTAQRLELLRGLLDGDGSISTNGTTYRIEYSSCRERLSEGVLYLARSLGWQARMNRSGASLDGEAKQDRYRVTWTPTTDDPCPFHLSRKAARVQSDQARGGGRHTVTVTSIEPEGTGDGYCIQVDSPDGLFLAGRDLVTTHNSTLCAVWAPIRALQLNPDTRVIIATYGDSLAEEHSAAARDIIVAHGTGAVDSITGKPVEDRLGLRLRQDSTKVSRWRVEGGRGGVVAAGLGSSITGKAADLMIIDDPFKNMQEADSSAHRRKVMEWFRAVALTRLAPNASILLIQTRWHPDDLAGQVLAAEAAAQPAQRTWRYINIPAVAEEGVSDALGREPGTAMVSARGRTAADFAATRRSVGERVWYALYQGVPAPVEGGLFARDWFSRHRLGALDEPPVATIVGVDPAETGEGDEAGVVAAALLRDGTIALTHDRSGHMTSDQWARAAIRLALETSAREIAFEAYSTPTTYRRVLRETYAEMRRDALAFRDSGLDLSDADRVLCANPGLPFRLHPWRGKGDAVVRSGMLRHDLEVGKARVVGAAMAVMEEQAREWQEGQHQPDRIAATIIAHDRVRALIPNENAGAAAPRGSLVSAGRAVPGAGGAPVGGSAYARRLG